MPFNRISSASFALVAASVLILSACGKSNQPAAAAAPAPVSVSAVKLITRPLPLVLEAVGRTEGSKEVEIRARVSGTMERQVYEEGTVVKAGAVLFLIDRKPFEIALDQARAALAQERARNQQAKRDVDRLKGLVDERAISRREADDATTGVQTSDAAIQAADARVREAELNLSYTTVAAPIPGMTGRAQRSEGSLVTAGSDSSLMTTMVQTDPIWVRFALSQPEYDALRRVTGSGKDATAVAVALMSAEGKVRGPAGKLNFAGSVVDTTLGTVQLRATFANPDLAILPGEYARVRLTSGARPGITVPQIAVLQGDQGKYVWVIGADDKVTQRVIQTGAWLGADWIVLDGLKEGERVAVDNLLKLRAGAAVQVQERAAAAAANAPSAAATNAAANAPAAASK